MEDEYLALIAKQNAAGWYGAMAMFVAGVVGGIGVTVLLLQYGVTIPCGY